LAKKNIIILIGFSTTGKSMVGREVARRLGWEFVDSDDEIVKLAGKTIPEIFQQDGEENFRKLERQVLKRICQDKGKVVASGGGAILNEENRQLLQESGLVVCLEAKPETIYQRLVEDTQASGQLRPLLNVSNPLERIESLKEFRQPYYAMADWTVHTDNLTMDEVAQEVVRGWHYWRKTHQNVDRDLFGQECLPAVEVITQTESYPVFIGWGWLERLGEKLLQANLSPQVYLISDETVQSLYGDKVIQLLQKSGFQLSSFTVPAGEKSKTLATASQVYDWLVDHHAERGDNILALGGGMVGDLVGFVAATFLRGMNFVQVPTSLVAMVDAAIGGKTAVNLPQAKNLIGAFYQPRLVLADVATLTTLPHQELISGYAEVIKHSLIADESLFYFLESHIDELINLVPEITVEVIRRSAVIKAQIVSEDEKEQGKRTLLNYGHTIGHALEAATNYQKFLHGEAVAIGMMGTAKLSQRLGLLSQEIVDRQQRILEKFGLPIKCPGIDLNAILKAMELDKKVRGKAIRWVLLQDIGKPVIQDNVAREEVVAVLGDLINYS
jgi:3-dehydroquinate synthase